MCLVVWIRIVQIAREVGDLPREPSVDADGADWVILQAGRLPRLSV